VEKMASFAPYQSFSQGYGGFGAHGNMTVVDKVLPDMLHLIDPHWYQFQVS
jgi:r-opsin